MASQVVDRLRTLKVRDVMVKNVVHVFASQKMAAVAEVFVKHRISAAPVVDEFGRCVGILSATDFLRRDRSGDADERPTLAMGKHDLAHESENDAWRLESSPNDLAAEFMSTGVQTIHSEESILTAGRLMCGQHIHRLFVLGHDERVVGVLSTMDIVAAVLNAVDELDLKFDGEGEKPPDAV